MRPYERPEVHPVPAAAGFFAVPDPDCLHRMWIETTRFLISFQRFERRMAPAAACGRFDMANVLHHVLAANRHLSVTK
jgi:hypothetical protein